jgi:hypothetical protein
MADETKQEPKRESGSLGKSIEQALAAIKSKEPAPAVKLSTLPDGMLVETVYQSAPHHSSRVSVDAEAIKAVRAAGMHLVGSEQVDVIMNAATGMEIAVIVPGSNQSQFTSGGCRCFYRFARAPA